MDIDGVKIVNVYDLPISRMISSATPVFPHPCFYADDFNCLHVDWGYSTTSPDGEHFGWLGTKSNLDFLHNPKDAPSFLWTLEHRYQPRLGLREQWSRLLATGQTHPGKVF